jgi:hypothetical protein
MTVYVYSLDNPEVNNPYSTEDYGSISSAFISSEDIGAVNDESPTFNFLEDDWYNISISESLIPYGTIGTLITSRESATYQYISSGQLFEFATQSLTENVVFTWVGSGTVFEIGNGLERTVNPYIASGTLRMDQTVAETALESIAIDYNESSIETGNVIDYGNIADIFSGLPLDYGQVPEAAVPQIGDYDLITNSVIPIVYPFGGITLSGSAICSANYRLYLDGQAIVRTTYSEFVSGSIILSTSGIESETESYIGTGTLTLSGTSIEKDLDSYVGVGTLSFSGTSLESYSAQTPEDFVLYTFNGTIVEKNTESYVGIGTAYFSETLIESETESYVGAGILIFSGIALEVYSANTPENTQLFTISGTGLEVYSANTPENTQLFSISGTSIEKDVDSYVGSGTLFGFGNLIESITYSYNESSVIEGALDYGLIIHSPSLFDDYGPLGNGGPTVDFGEVSVSAPSVVGDLVYPFGNISIGGTALDAYSAQTPEDFALYTFSGIASCREIANYLYLGDTPTLILSGELVHPNIDYTPHYGIEKNIGIGTTGIQISGELVHPNIDYTPHYGIEKNIGIGTTGIQLSGAVVERFVEQGDESTQLFTISGTGLEVYSANTPENTQLFSISGTSIEKDVDSYVGVGTLSFSGTSLESYSAQTPEDFVLYTFSGTALEVYSANTPENTQLFSISGTSIEKDVDSYVGLGILTLSGVVVEKDVDSYVGVGTLSFSGTSLESYSAQTPEDFVLYTFSGELVHPNIDYTPHYGIEKNIGIGTTGIKFGIGVGASPDSEGNLRDAKTYSNRYPINDKVPGAGIGTFRFDQTNDLAKYSPLTPYTGTGLFDIVTGFSPQESYPWLPGPGVGKSWSFTRSTYIASGQFTIFGNGLTRIVRTFGYTGSGNVTISQQTSPILEKEVDVYVGSGSITLGAGSDKVLRQSKWRGTGTLFTLSGGSESFSAQTPDNTILYQFSSSANESLSSIPSADQPTLIIGGSASDESITISEVGTGVIPVDVFGTAAVSSYTPSISNTALFKFTQHTSDILYDSCDSEEFTCDYQDAANVTFVANPVENTILFTLSGIASTREIVTYSYNGIGTELISGSYQSVKFVSSEIGFGTIFITTSSDEKEGDVYNGSGSLFALSGKTESYSTQTPESTILISISGSATTRVESEYSVVGIGVFTISGISSTRKIVTYAQVGSGIATLSGELLYPNIKFIPSFITFGSISILGSSDDSLTKIFKNTSGTLFGFSSGLESFTKSTYVGVGTIYIEETFGTTINNSFQIPRTYVVII